MRWLILIAAMAPFAGWVFWNWVRTEYAHHKRSIELLAEVRILNQLNRSASGQSHAPASLKAQRNESPHAASCSE